MKLKKLFGGLSALALTLGIMGTGTSAFAATVSGGSGTDQQVNSGSLSITPPSGADFKAQVLNGVSETQSISQQITAVDATGTGDGWHVTVQSTKLTGSTTGKALPSGCLSLNYPAASDITAVGTTSTSPAASGTVGSLVAIDGASPVTMVSAGANQGMGTYNINFKNLTLTVPPNTYADTYYSLITWSIVTGP